MRLSHLAAAATLVALLGAMFMVMQPASAHDLGDCAANPEWLTEAKCDAEEGTTFDHDNDPNTAAIESWTAGTHTAANHPPSLSISFDDSDGIVSPGTPVTVTITSSGIFSSAPSNPPVAGSPADGLPLAWVRVSGELDDPAETDLTLDSTASETDDASTSSETFTVIVPAGTTPGSYTVSTMIASGFDYSGRAVTNKVATKAFTVGDAGTGISEAVLPLGNRIDDDPSTFTDETTPESGTAAADGDSIKLVVSAMNSLGNKANNGDVSQITVIAPGGKISIHAASNAGTPDDPSDDTASTDEEPNSSSISEDEGTTGDDVRQSVAFSVSKADGKPGTVDVYVILTGKGADISETRTLQFTGDASSLELGEASGSLHYQMTTAEKDNRDKITFSVGATDSGGNSVGSIPSVVPTVTDPKGRRVAPGRIKIVQGKNASGVDNAQITVENLVGDPSSLAIGAYTLKVMSGGNSAESTFNVVGNADGVALEVSTDSPSEVGEQIEVTATVTSGGIQVANGTSVTFRSRDTFGDSDSVLVDTTPEVTGSKSGIAKATYVAIGPGSAVITATASNKTAVKVIESAAGAVEEEAMPEEEASVSCLSELSGFSTWTCGVDSSASEVFELVADRGKSAIHLWNGSAWVRYSVVDDAMVPGSSDFMVTENDILYISD